MSSKIEKEKKDDQKFNYLASNGYIIWKEEGHKISVIYHMPKNLKKCKHGFNVTLI